MEINAFRGVVIKHGKDDPYKNLEALDTILVHTSLFEKLQKYLVENNHAETLEEAGSIIKTKIAPLARKVAPLAKV